MSWLWNPGQRSLKVIGTDTYRSATYNFLLTFHSNHGPILYHLRDKRQFESKIVIKKFPTPRYFAPLLKGFPWELGIGARVKKKLEFGATGPRKKSDDIFSRLDTMHQHDRQTDRHWVTAKTALTHSIAWSKLLQQKSMYLERYLIDGISPPRLLIL